MSLLAALGFGSLARERRSLTWSSVFGPDWDPPTSAAGVHVSRDRALTVSAWIAGVRIRAGIYGRLGPPRVMRREGGGYVVDRKHPLHRVLTKFRGNMTARDFYKSRIAGKVSDGSGYAYVVRVGGKPVELIPLRSDCVEAFRENDRDGYLYTPPWSPGTKQAAPLKIPAEDIVHFKGLSLDGGPGWKTWALARDTLGASIAMRQHGSRFFANGAAPTILLESPAAWSEDQEKAFMARFNRAYSGVDKHYVAMMLSDGVKAQAAPTQVDAEKAQLIESRFMEAREVANFLGVKPAHVGVPETRPLASAEMDSIEFMDQTVEDCIASSEEALSVVLLTEDEQASGDVLIQFDRERLASVDAKSRAEADKAGLAGVPWLTRDEVRQRRGLAPLPNGEGSTVLVPINLQAAAEPGSQADPSSEPTPPDPKAPPAAPPQDPAAARKASAFDAFVAATRGRMLARLVASVRHAAKKPAEFTTFAAGLRDAHEPIVREAFAPADGVVDTKGEVDALFAAVGVACDRAQACKPSEFAAAVERECAALEKSR